MYRCLGCGEVFHESEAEEKNICYEDYYGVADLFHGRHYFTLMVCPFCGYESLEYCEEEDEEEEI